MVTRGKQTGRLAGFGLLAFMVISLLVTLWLLLPGKHPLAGQVEYDLCTAIEEPLQSLGGTETLQYTLSVPPSGAGGMACVVSYHNGRQPQQSAGEVHVSLLTTAMLRRMAGMRGDTRQYTATFVAESRASGYQVAAAAGPWGEGWLMQVGADHAMLIAEDDGVVLVVNAQRIPAEHLAPFAIALAQRLRQS